MLCMLIFELAEDNLIFSEQFASKLSFLLSCCNLDSLHLYMCELWEKNKCNEMLIFYKYKIKKSSIY